MSSHAADLVKFFETKPTHKQTFIFKVRDVYPPPMGKGHYIDTESVRKRKSLGVWLYRNMKPIATIPGFNISLYMAVIPYRYLATRGMH